MARLSTFTKTNLNKQGFGKLDDKAKSRYALPLRFTPGVGTILIVIGLALQSPIWLGSMALVALSGALRPSGMLIDLVYNLGFRHLFGAPALPPTPKPRQFSYLLSTVWLAGSALSFSSITGCRCWGLSWEERLSSGPQSSPQHSGVLDRGGTGCFSGMQGQGGTKYENTKRNDFDYRQ